MREVSKCEYWGDLELSYDELEVLKSRIQSKKRFTKMKRF